jgi:phosphocarrier protein
MIELSMDVVNRLGLHARAAAKFVTLAGSFASTVELGIGDHWVNGKSIMAVMMLAARKGMVLIMRVEGVDEVEAAQRLSNLVAGRFGEPE